MNNAKAISIIKDRLSSRVQRFNDEDVDLSTSDAHHDLCMEAFRLAENTLSIIPEIKIKHPYSALGDIYRAIKENLTPEVRQRWNSIYDQLDQLEDQYF